MTLFDGFNASTGRIIQESTTRLSIGKYAEILSWEITRFQKNCDMVLGIGCVMNDSDKPSQRQETWHEDDHEYYTRLHVTLIGAGMENYPIFLGTVYWTVSRS